MIDRSLDLHEWSSMKRARRRVLAKRERKAPLAPCIGWYAPEQYARLREVFTDKDNLHDHWSQWEAKASETLELLRAQGIPARKVAIDVEEMIAWCESQGKPLDGASRAEFIGLKCRELGIAEQQQR